MPTLHCWKDWGEHMEDVHGWGTPEYWRARLDDSGDYRPGGDVHA